LDPWIQIEKKRKRGLISSSAAAAHPSSVFPRSPPSEQPDLPTPPAVLVFLVPPFGRLAFRHLISLSPPSLPLLPGRRRRGKRRRVHQEGGPGGGTTGAILLLAEFSPLLVGSDSGCNKSSAAGGHRQPCRPSTLLAVLPS